MVAETETATPGWQRPRLAGAREFASRHALLLIVAAGATIRFATLGSQGFWIDEHVQILTLRHPPSELLATIMNSETQPVLYLVVAKAWQSVFGLGEVGLRSLSALAGAATIPVVYAAGRASGSRRAGLFAAALTATSPFMIWYSQEARPYALFAFVASLSFLFFVQALQGRDVRWLWAWAIASVLTASAHYFGFLLIGVEAVWLLWSLRRSRIDVAMSITAIGAASVPLVLLGLSQQQFTGWIGFMPAGDRLFQVPQNLLAGLATPWEMLPPLVVALVFLSVVYLVATSKPGELNAAVVPAGVAAAGLSIVVSALIFGSDYLVTRNLIGFWPPLAVALGAVLAVPAASAARRIGTATLLIVCVTGVSLAVWQAVTPTASRPDWKPLVDAMGPAEVPRAIEYPYPFTIPLVHDLPNAHELVPGETATVEEIVVVEFRSVDNHSIGPCWWQGICGGELLGLIGSDLVTPEQSVHKPGVLFTPVPEDYELFGRGKTELFTFRRFRGPPIQLPDAGQFGALVLVQTPP
jgi:uncharacterized membrane protein